jgi:indolepyruvate ferredoxin oxidoreductase alpha subunit
VEFVEVVDPFNLKQAASVIEKAIRFPGPAVVVSRRLCTIIEQREKRKRHEETIPYYVDPERCSEKCNSCIELLGCPAIIKEGAKAIIDSSLCTGCGFCAQVCPYQAIVPEKRQ